MFVSHFDSNSKLCNAITNSSKDAFPARSPIPLIVTCAHDAPACIPEIAFATANPKSLWQCTLIGNFETSIASLVISPMY